MELAALIMVIMGVFFGYAYGVGTGKARTERIYEQIIKSKNLDNSIEQSERFSYWNQKVRQKEEESKELRARAQKAEKVAAYHMDDFHEEGFCIMIVGGRIYPENDYSQIPKYNVDRWRWTDPKGQWELAGQVIITEDQLYFKEDIFGYSGDTDPPFRSY